jgi:hypothetical protein
MELSARRRWTILDAIVLIACLAGGLAPAIHLMPEIVPLVRQIDVKRLFDTTVVSYLFQARPKSGRMDSGLIQLNAMIRPIVGRSQPRWSYRDPRTGRTVMQQGGLENWVKTHGNYGSSLGRALSQDLYFLMFPFLLLGSLGLTLLRLIPPRPRWRSLVRRPGFCVGIAPLVVFPLTVWLEIHDGYPVPSVVAPASVGFAWLGLWLIRCWQAEPTWIDRAGRVLGVTWIATLPLFLVGFGHAIL